MIVRYRYMISKPDGRYYSEAEAKYDLQKQGFYIMKTYRVINEIRMFDINTKVMVNA